MKTVIITGGGSGIGAETARLLAKSEYHLILVGRTESKLLKVQEEIKKLGGTASIYACDLSSAESVKSLALFAKSIGEIYAVLHIAGLSPHMGDAKKIIDGNVRATMNIHNVFENYILPGGILIDTSSTSAYLAPEIIMPKKAFRMASDNNEKCIRKIMRRVNFFPKKVRSGVAYAISKAFVISYVKSEAVRLGKKNIRVLSVTPGNFETPMGKLEGEEANKYTKYSAFQRNGNPKEIATLYTELLNPELTYLTGTDILCDGGTIAGYNLK